MSATEQKPSEWRDRAKKWREDLLKGIAIGVPTLLINKFNQVLVDRANAQPWEILWYAIPLIAAGWLTWRMAKRASLTRVPWALVLFLVIYCAGFALLSTSDLLVWNRTPRVQPEASRSWILPVTLGDWRYKLVPRSEAAADVAIVMLDQPAQGRDPNWIRAQKLVLVQLIDSAERIRGVGFDFFFEGPSDLDGVLCDAIKAVGKPVLSGYTIQAKGGKSAPIRPQVNPLAACIPFESRQGHLLAWADADQAVRTLPLHWRDLEDRPAFSLQIARALESKDHPLVLPHSKLLRYLAPADEMPEYDFKSVQAEPALLSDKFIIVGEHSPQDTFDTPFGPHSGTWIQAAAVHSLRASTYMTKASAVSSALLVFVACYAVMLLVATGAPLRKLIIAAGVISLCVFALAAAAAYLRVWLDAIYAVVACWLLVPLAFALRRSLATRNHANSR